MDLFNTVFKKLILPIFLLGFLNVAAHSEEEQGDSTFIKSIAEEVKIISQDLKTLEKAVYNSSDITSKASSGSNNLN